ncbi:MAG TPA: hypothetical protein VFR47_17690 [Anaerolineales bacterium]|nr:hypothetical protein [Anaerolineales bacterium]
MNPDSTLRQELSQARAAVAALEADIRRQEAILARLHSLLARLQRSGPRDEAVSVVRQLASAEAVRQALLERLSAGRKQVEGLLAGLLQTPDPADIFGLLEARQAIALLPIRLETHFRSGLAGTELLVRIYPDDVHVETHEPELTDEEVQAGQAFWRATLAADALPEAQRPAARLAAWAQLAGRFTPERAAWVARVLTPERPDPNGEPAFPETPRRKEAWTRPPQARALPDRWVILGYRGGQRIFAVWGNPVPDPLPVGLSPEAEIPLPAEGEPAVDPVLRWMFDFTEAERLGMGVRIPLGAGRLARIDLLLALGVKASADDQESAGRLAALLDGHHYTSGLGFVRQGTPTNNTEAARSAFNQPDATFERSFARERGDPLFSPGDGSNGDLTALAFGLDPSLFAHVLDSGLQEQTEARCMNAALWHSTWGYFLEQVMAPVFKPTEIAAFRRHFVEHVRGRGPLPVIRVGSQPYGLLPVTTLDGLVLDRRSETLGSIFSFVKKLRDLFWKPGIAGVPHVGRGGDPDRTLLEILGMDATSLEIAGRTVFGDHYFRNWWAWMGLSGFAEYSQHKQTLARLALTRLGVNWTPRALDFSFLPSAHELTGPRVQDGPLSETQLLSPNYLTWLRTASPSEIQAEAMPEGAPDTLLYRLLRHAALMAYGVTAFRLMARFHVLESAIQPEPELLHFNPDAPTLTVLNALDRPIPELTENAPLGDYLHTRHEFEDVELEDYSEFWEALECLESLSTAALDRLLPESLDLCSHRLDAWITSFTALALQRLRQDRQSRGVHLGGYGWVENLEPAEARRSAGYIHAPSLQQAMTAAVLRSGYLSHAGTEGDKALAIDLSSTRVRLALDILDAVRQGQPLGAVLGYRFERGLHEGHPGRELDRYILPLRNLAPLVARKLEQTNEPLESIAAHNVVDGLALQRRWKAGEIPWGQQDLPALGSPDEVAISLELKTLDDVIDALSDAVTAESVFQAIRGNPTRSGNVLDAIARGEAPPPELEVVRTTRSGIALTHRLLLGFSGTPTPPTDWPVDARQVRAFAEPHLNVWVGSMLGNPGQVRCRVEYLDPESRAILLFREIRLSELNLSPLDVLAITILDEKEGSELERRLAYLASNPLPPGIPETAAIRLVFQRDPDWAIEVVDFIALSEVVQALREMVSRARSLAPADLALPGESPGEAFDVIELRERANTAVQAYARLVADLQDLLATPESADLDSLRDMLIRAAHFGLQGAFPLSLRGEDPPTRQSLLAQAASVERETSRRLVRVQALEAAFDRAGATPTQQCDHDQIRLGQLFGEGFRILPRFIPANSGELAQVFAASSAIQGGDSQQAVIWLQRMTRVRPGAASLGDAYLYADALSGTDPLNLQVGQLPFQAGDRWIGLPVDEAHPLQANRLSLVAQLPVGFDPAGPVAGLLVDEWVETVPSSAETTAVAFHFDEPGSRAPNAILLAVPPDPSRPWDLATLEKIMIETFELAKLRAVDTEALAGLGQFLPALFFATNVRGETVATDFTRGRVAAPGEEIG